MKLRLVTAFLLVTLVLASPVIAQEEASIRLSLSRDFGSSIGGNIQGVFSYRVEGSSDLERVVFLIDGDTIGEDTEPPFRLQFRTDNFALGSHSLSAIGYMKNGSELKSNTINRQFVSGSDSTKTALLIIIPILVIAFGGRMASSWIANRNRPNKKAPALIGPYGGTLCPKCGRPFAMHIWGFNIVVGKFDRCPHCGKWSLVRRVHPDALHSAAEAFVDDDDGESAEMASKPLGNEEDNLHQKLNDSRFDNSQEH